MNLENKRHRSTKPVQPAFFKNYWWVLVFTVLCFSFYFHSIHKKNMELALIKEEKIALSKEQEEVLSEQEDLLEKIHSQSDPAWIEMVLMKELGVVPEGKVKVHFKNEAEE